MTQRFQKNYPKPICHGHVYGTGKSGSFEEETLDKIDDELKEAKICLYYNDCPLYKYSMKCIFGQDKCRTFHFYNKYKDFNNGRQMGI